MSKYIDADLLKSGLIHLREKFPILTYEAVLFLITSLQQEQPEVDLEKELQAFLCNYDYEFDDDAPACDIARHFYELGLNARKEK